MRWLHRYLKLVVACTVLLIAAGGMVIIIFPVAVINGEYFRLALPTLLTAALLPFWPFVCRGLRWSRRTDYERRLDEASTPSAGIIE